jgi:hypothetical protein
LRIFYLHRAAYRAPIDWRAAEAIAAQCASTGRQLEARCPQDSSDGGMTITQFAEWAGVTRTGIGRHMIEIPPGDPPQLPPGAVPFRRIGATRRVFKADLLGASVNTERQRSQGVDHASDKKAPPGSASRPAWNRSIAELRDRFSRDK